MTIEDYGETLELWLADPSLGVSPQFDTRGRIAAYLARNPGLSTVARVGGRIVGAALCGHDGRRGSLCHVGVREGSRRRGIARQMVERCLVRLKEQGIDTASVHVWRDRELPLQFWEGIGWHYAANVGYLSKGF